MSQPIMALAAALQRWERGSLAVSLIAWIACLIGAWLGSAPDFFRAYFAAYLFFLGVTLGCLALLMLYHLTGGAWGYLIRRILEAQVRTLPLMAVLFVPIALGLPSLYVWGQPEAVAHSERLQEQQFYLNVPFQLVRAVIYFAVWLLTAWALLVRTRRQANTGDERLPWQLQRLSEVGLVMFGTTMHFATFDWIEMLQPSFHSTIFPLLIVAGHLLSAQSLAIVIFVTVSLRTEVGELASGRVLNDLGNMLLAFLVIWAYLFWFQFMLGWMADQRADAEWTLPRSRGGWLWVTWFLIALGFAIPLISLLMRSVKGTPSAIRRVAGTILVTQLVYNFYLTLPSLPPAEFRGHWFDAFTPAAIGGLWLASFLWALRSHPLLVEHDPNRERAVHAKSREQVELSIEEAVAHG